MQREERLRRGWRVSLGLLLFATGACVDEKIVFREGPPFIAPPAAAANFLGYHNEASGLTTCGNCHVTQQGKWEQTAHADAWATLQATGASQALCEGCHSVSEQGNAVTATEVGYTSTKDSRYHDVQCESCHGPGLDHVTAPARGQMLASIHADTGAAVTNGCAECHSGVHHPFVEEWRSSRHGRPQPATFNGATATSPEVAFAPRTSCRGCHVGQYVLDAWGVNTNYLEKTGATRLSDSEGVTCVVCHDPHGSPFTAQLRYAVDAKDTENNLCARCHNRNANPPWSSSRTPFEPHAAQGPLVFGSAGWWPPGLQFDTTASTHGSEANPRLCATCHVQNYNVNDKLTGAFQVTVVGHRFLAIPCVDANGAPTEDQGCQVASRSFKSCSASGCHSSEASARLAWVNGEADVHTLADLLEVMIDQVPASEFVAPKVTAGRGATFNLNLARQAGTAAHNPFLVKALLRYSGLALNQTYGIPLPPGLAPTAADAKRVRQAN